MLLPACVINKPGGQHTLSPTRVQSHGHLGATHTGASKCSMPTCSAAVQYTQESLRHILHIQVRAHAVTSTMYRQRLAA